MPQSAEMDRKPSREQAVSEDFRYLLLLVRLKMPPGQPFAWRFWHFFPPDGAQKCKSAQKSNVLGGELIKCFQTSKKKRNEKRSVQVEFMFGGQAWGTPGALLQARPLTDSLELYRGDQTTGGTAGSQTAIFVLCGLFVTEGAQDPAVFCLPKGNVSQGTAESSKHPF